MWGFQSLRIERAIEREEKRQANIERFGLDPVEATIALHSRRLSLS